LHFPEKAMQAMKILIVEDNQAMRRMIRRMVTDVADQISECDDGAAACALYRQLRPDWVLMDIEMGQVNGLTATRQIIADYPEARVVMVTNYDDAQLRETARVAGACEYVLKENLLALRRILLGQSDPGAPFGLL
jgi:CheY-like chemotaxis protein